jgi:hypothetical protein
LPTAPCAPQVQESVRAAGMDGAHSGWVWMVLPDCGGEWRVLKSILNGKLLMTTQEKVS